MTIKNKLLGSSLILGLMVAALLIASIYTFVTLGAGFIEIIDKSKVGVINSQKTKSDLSNASKNLLIVSKEMQSIGDEINQTNMQMKLLERKIKEISTNLGDFTGLAEEITADIPESDLLYDLQEMFDSLGDIEEIMRREALVGLTRTAKKMVAFTNTIGKEVKTINTLSSGIQEIDKLSTEVVLANQEINQVSGEFNQKIKVSKKLIVSLLIVVGLFAIISSMILGFSISKRMNAAVAALNDIAHGDGDLTQRLDSSGKDEISQLASAFNLFSSKIQNIIKEVSDSANVIDKAVDKVTLVNDSTNETVNKQDKESSKVADSVRKISASIEYVTKSASNAASEARHAENQAATGHDVVEKNHRSINELASELVNAERIIQDLEEKSHEIGSILDTIRGVAEQTNLLALNAAIEAARAGENGRGFAVVADEVRNLAHKTQESTTEIQYMITSLQDMTQQSVVAMKNGREKAEMSVEHATITDESLNAISITIKTINNLNSSIEKETVNQLSSTVEIENNINNMGGISNTSIEGVAFTEKALLELAEQIEKLKKMVGQFKVA